MVYGIRCASSVHDQLTLSLIHQARLFFIFLSTVTQWSQSQTLMSIICFALSPSCASCVVVDMISSLRRSECGGGAWQETSPPGWTDDDTVLATKKRRQHRRILEGENAIALRRGASYKDSRRSLTVRRAGLALAVVTMVISGDDGRVYVDAVRDSAAEAVTGQRHVAIMRLLL